MDSTVDAAALAAAMAGGPAPVLLDVRWRLGGPPGLDRHPGGPLPRAQCADLDRDLAGPPGTGGRHPLPDAGTFQAAMRRAGISDDRPVVAYDENDSTAAARAWWLLRYFGHQQVQVLDGGYQAWLAADLPIETGPAAAPGAGTFTARPGHLPLLDAEGAARMAREGVLLDARAAGRYRGAAERRDRFTRLGVGAAAPGTPAGAVTTGVYCGSGVTAAHEVLAMTIAGIPAALYVGSWSDWITDPARPVGTGPAPR